MELNARQVTLIKKSAKQMKKVLGYSETDALYREHGKLYGFKYNPEEELELCKAYLNQELKGCSPACPMKRATGKDYCEGTPREVAITKFNAWADRDIPTRQKDVALRRLITYMENLGETKDRLNT